MGSGAFVGELPPSGGLHGARAGLGRWAVPGEARVGLELRPVERSLGLAALHLVAVARAVRGPALGVLLDPREVGDVLGQMLGALTGWGQDDDRRKSEEAGFNGHLVKPVDYDQLLELLAELANGR